MPSGLKIDLFNCRPPLRPRPLLFQIVTNFGEQLVQQGISVELMFWNRPRRVRRCRRRQGSFCATYLPTMLVGSIHNTELVDRLMKRVKVCPSPSLVSCAVFRGPFIKHRRMMYRLDLKPPNVSAPNGYRCVARAVPIRLRFSRRVEIFPNSPDTF